jgi:hypothetical protein
MKLFRFLQFLLSVVFGPRVPKVQVGYCREMDHMVVTVGDDMLATHEVRPTNANGIIGRLELWCSDEDLASVVERAMTGIPFGPGLCLAADTLGAEGDRIVGELRRNPAFLLRVYLQILKEADKLRARPDFATRAEYWRIHRVPLYQMREALARFAADGIDDGNAGLFVVVIDIDHPRS